MKSVFLALTLVFSSLVSEAKTFHFVSEPQELYSMRSHVECPKAACKGDEWESFPQACRKYSERLATPTGVWLITFSSESYNGRQCVCPCWGDFMREGSDE